MPEWLLKEENYTPKADKDTFINKSILSLLSILSRIRSQSSYSTDKFYVNPAFKIAFTLMLVTLITITRNFTFIVVIDVYLLVILSVMEAEDIVKIFKLSLIMATFTFIIILPAALWGDSSSGILLTFKVFTTLTAVNILSHSTRWNSLTSALKRFFVPDIFIFVLDITIKYIVMLGDIMLNMLYSLKLRSVGKNKGKYTSLSGIAGTMFIKSKEMAEDMYSAMECRGFNGEYHTSKKFKFTFADGIYIIINLGIILTFVYLY